MEIIDSLEKVIQPGLWLVRSRQPITDVGRFVYEIGVELGDGMSADNLGYIYEYGYGVDEDYDKAMEYYAIAEELGYYEEY